MKILRKSLILVFCFIFLIQCNKSSPTEPIDSTGPIIITFPSMLFEIVIRDALNKPSGDITDFDMLTIVNLNGWSKRLYSIDGIEYCKNLEYLDLYNNQISDISGIADMPKLDLISLNNNNISDLKHFVDNENYNSGELYIYDNPLSLESKTEHIPILEARGVVVHYNE